MLASLWFTLAAAEPVPPPPEAVLPTASSLPGLELRNTGAALSASAIAISSVGTALIGLQIGAALANPCADSCRPAPPVFFITGVLAKLCAVPLAFAGVPMWVAGTRRMTAVERMRVGVAPQLGRTRGLVITARF